MTKGKFVVKRSQLPIRLPIALTIASITALDHFKAGTFWCIIAGLVLTVLWIHSIIEYRNEIDVAVFEDRSGSPFVGYDGKIEGLEKTKADDGRRN